MELNQDNMYMSLLTRRLCDPFFEKFESDMDLPDPISAKLRQLDSVFAVDQALQEYQDVIDVSFTIQTYWPIFGVETVREVPN